jgi:dTDP-4-amino-4,6-dideoxygalactose transaminase
MIPLHKVFMPPNLAGITQSVSALLESGWIGEGPKVAEFEEALGPVLGRQNVTAVNSCTSAIHLALRLAGVGAGDEVITTAMTCSATNEPILIAGATPVWADIDPTSGNISPEDIREKLTDKTRAVVVVHWGGYPCDLDEIMDIGKEAGVAVIEDAAHSIGSTYHGAPIGSHADYVCFSFQAIKTITTGDGGALVCRDADAHRLGRSLRWLGIDRERRQVNEYNIADWDIVHAGYKFHMNDIAAVIGLGQLPHLEDVVTQRRANAQAFKNAFETLERVELLTERDDRSSAYWLFTVFVDKQVDFIRHLGEKGIAASIVHRRNDQYTVFREYQNPDLPGLDAFTKRMVCIPVGPWLSESDRQHIIDVISAENW